MPDNQDKREGDKQDPHDGPYPNDPMKNHFYAYNAKKGDNPK